jgi:hypothetical protein
MLSIYRLPTYPISKGFQRTDQTPNQKQYFDTICKRQYVEIYLVGGETELSALEGAICTTRGSIQYTELGKAQ